ncbi:unnamed protein product [Schistocephalus solidus]|uniref:Uncharacterized protein n=1 Tax=Schistocephalus solidus TaxID=70667 RepID=A0A183SH49_SCHSO|nr:unnamed protein product [Schistocephalus solidus]
MIPALRSADGKLETDDQVNVYFLSKLFKAIFTLEPNSFAAIPPVCPPMFTPPFASSSSCSSSSSFSSSSSSSSRIEDLD